ncbi:MAG: hypothetical protein K2K16_05850 [Ruminococcus sp.]|nr:hypothetical protein [Ruminococcus sp.]
MTEHKAIPFHDESCPDSEDESVCKGYFEESYCKDCWLYPACSGELKFNNNNNSEPTDDECDDDYGYYDDDDYYGYYDDECREIFDRYRCKGCKYYDDCFYNECAAEVESDNLYRAMQGEPPEKIFGGTDINEAEIIANGDLPF